MSMKSNITQKCQLKKLKMLVIKSYVLLTNLKKTFQEYIIFLKIKVNRYFTQTQRE